MKAIVINENGGPEKVTFTEVDTPCPGPGQLQVAVETAGVNYLDIYQRQGRGCGSLRRRSRGRRSRY